MELMQCSGVSSSTGFCDGEPKCDGRNSKGGGSEIYEFRFCSPNDSSNVGRVCRDKAMTVLLVGVRFIPLEPSREFELVFVQILDAKYYSG